MASQKPIKTYVSVLDCLVYHNTPSLNFPVAYKIYAHFSALLEKLSNNRHKYYSTKAIPLIELEDSYILGEVGRTPLKSKNPILFSLPTSPHGQKYSQEQFHMEFPTQTLVRVKLVTLPKVGAKGLFKKHRDFVKAIENNLVALDLGNRSVMSLRLNTYLEQRYASEFNLPHLDDNFSTSSRNKISVSHKLI